MPKVSSQELTKLQKEFAEQVRAQFEIGDDKIVRVKIEVKSRAPRPKIRVDYNYQLTTEDWHAIRAAFAKCQHLRLRESLQKLLRDHHVQFPIYTGGYPTQANRLLKDVGLSFVLRSPDKGSWPERVFRLYKFTNV